MVSADPPITEFEVELLQPTNGKLARLFLILNKVDYLDPDERAAAVAFLQRVLREQVGFASPPPIFCLSARQGLATWRDQDMAAWEQSGMARNETRRADGEHGSGRSALRPRTTSAPLRKDADGFVVG